MNGTQLHLRCWGRRYGRPKAEETAFAHIGVRNGLLEVMPAGESVPLTVPREGLRGTLPAPEPDTEGGRTLVLTARLVNVHGETVAFSRSTVTSEVQPLGLIQTDYSPRTTSFKELLSTLGLEWRAVRLTGNLEEDVSIFKKWRLLVLEDQLTPTSGEHLRAVLGRLDPRPALLFVGSKAARSAQADGRTLLTNPLPQGEARKIVFVCDRSGSMNTPARGRTLPRWQLARTVTEKLRPGLQNRDVNHLVAAYVDLERRNRCGLGTDKTFNADALACPIDLYAGDEIDDRNRDDWELADHILFALDLAKRDPRVSDVVMIYDPADAYQRRGLPGPSQQAAKELEDMGVRLHLIAVDQVEGGDRGALGTQAFDAVVASTQWVLKDRESKHRISVSSDALMIHHLQRYLFESTLPRLGVATAEEGRLRELLPGNTTGLHDFIAGPGKQVRLINALAPFKARDAKTTAAWAPAVADRTALWVRHWQHPDAASPLLLRDDIVLGPGKSNVVAFHLALDLNAENAASNDESINEPTEARDALAGLLMRVLGAVSRQWVAPTIHFAPSGDRIAFYRADALPFTIKPAAKPDTKTHKGVGLGAFLHRGGTWRPSDARPDTRTLVMPSLEPHGLDRKEARMTRLVIEDVDETIGRLTIDLPLTAAPPRPINQPADVALIASAAKGGGPEPGVATVGLPPPLLAAVLLAASFLLVMFAWRCL